MWASLNLQSAPSRSHLELAVRGEDADPSVVVVGHHNVAVHVHGDTCGSLQLSRGATSDPEPHLELTIVGKNLGWKEKERRRERERDFGVESESTLLGSTGTQMCVLTCMHWLLLSATTTLPLLEAEIPCRFVNSPFSRPRDPRREQQHTVLGSLPVSAQFRSFHQFLFTLSDV